MFSSILAAIKSASTWFLNHIKFPLMFSGFGMVVTIIWGCFRVARYAASAISDAVAEVTAAISSAGSATASVPGFLAKANYILPLSEMFMLFAVYVAILLSCFTVRGLTFCYRLIPFKAS